MKQSYHKVSLLQLEKKKRSRTKDDETFDDVRWRNRWWFPPSRIRFTPARTTVSVVCFCAYVEFYFIIFFLKNSTVEFIIDQTDWALFYAKISPKDFLYGPKLFVQFYWPMSCPSLHLP